MEWGVIILTLPVRLLRLRQVLQPAQGHSVQVGVRAAASAACFWTLLSPGCTGCSSYMTPRRRQRTVSVSPWAPADSLLGTWRTPLLPSGVISLGSLYLCVCSCSHTSFIPCPIGYFQIHRLLFFIPVTTRLVQMEAESWLICAVISWALPRCSCGRGPICEPTSSPAQQLCALTGPTLLPANHPSFSHKLLQLSQVDAICLQWFICTYFFPIWLRTSQYWPWFDLVPVCCRNHLNSLCRPRLEVHSIRLLVSFHPFPCREHLLVTSPFSKVEWAPGLVVRGLRAGCWPCLWSGSSVAWWLKELASQSDQPGLSPASTTSCLGSSSAQYHFFFL